MPKKKVPHRRKANFQTQQPAHEPLEAPELEQQDTAGPTRYTEHDIFWPEGQAMPERASRTHKTPCPSCRRVVGALGQAALKVRVGENVAYMRCRYCDHKWALPR